MALPPPDRPLLVETRLSELVKASKLSLEAWHNSNENSLSEFLSHAGVNNLFLINGVRSAVSSALFKSSSVIARKWGTDDMVLDLSKAGGREERLEYLRAAADFGGTVSLVAVELSQKEASAWWEALRLSHTTPPKSLIFSSRFLAALPASHQPGVISPGAMAAILLFDTLKQNTRIRNLGVFDSDLEFRSSNLLEGIALESLHLERISVISDEFLEALVRLDSHSISDRLALSFYHSRWNPSFHRFLQWQLIELSLTGFDLHISDLIVFMKHLESCMNSYLHRLTLGHLRTYASSATDVSGAVVDALHASGLPFLNLLGSPPDAAIEAQLWRNQQRHSKTLSRYKKVPATSLRLFICGDAYAGKTTLLSSLSYVCSRAGLLHRIKAYIMRYTPVQRTRGIEVRGIVRDKIQMSMWDMAGQTEFHAFHDHMFPDPSASHGSPAMFMFVWSPIDSKNQGKGETKAVDAFEASFRYWLKFISSKTRQSNVARKIVVVLTRKDQTDLVCDALAASVDALATRFNEIVEVAKVLEVDARSPKSIKPVASCIFKTARDVLNGVQVYHICNEVRKYLSLIRKQPIIDWDDFRKICIDKFELTDHAVQQAIASSLNESGDLIYLSNMPFLVLDPNWFCHEVMGRLIHFPDTHISRIIPIHGYARQDYLEKLLEMGSHFEVKGSLLVDLMEAMHLSCRVPNDPRGMVFIPATVSDSSLIEPTRHLNWRGVMQGRTHEFAYVGRRLECDKKDLTFLTPGLFPMIQVVFNKAFTSEINEADVKLRKNFMSICVQDMEIIVEFGLAKGEHVIDVMVRAPGLQADIGNTLRYVEDEIIRTLIRVCAQPVGNQGVTLVQGAIRPDCLQVPAPSHEREDQCVLIQDLKQKLRRQLEEGRRPEKLLYWWKENQYVQAVANRFIDLLGFEEYRKVLISYKQSLENAAEDAFWMSDIACTTEEDGRMQGDVNTSFTKSSLQGNQIRDQANYSQDQISADIACNTEEDGRMQGDVNTSFTKSSLQLGDQIRDQASYSQNQITEENIGHLQDQIVDANGEQIEVTVSKSMVKAIYREMQKSMNAKLDVMHEGIQDIRTKQEDIRTKLDAMHEEIHITLDALHQNICHLRGDVLPKIQRTVEQSLHFTVESETGKVPRWAFLTTGTKRKMVTEIFKDLKSVHIELFCEHRGGLHRVDKQEGISVTTVDEGVLKKALPYVNGFLKILTLVAKVGAHAVAGAGSMVPDFSEIIALGLDTPGFLDNQGLRGGAASPPEALTMWQQWLVSVLQQNGGMTESNIASKFKLRRALYEDTFQVAWLCGEHYKTQRPLPLV